MTGLIVKHWFFWRRVIPAENVWSDRSTFGADLYECRHGKPMRFIPQSSIVSRVPPRTTPLESADREVGA